MNFEFFEKLSREKAEEYLKHFLAVESAKIGGTLAEARASGLTVDFSLESVAPFLRWMVPKLNVVPGVPDPELPEWIRTTPTYLQNLFEFDEPSKILVLRAAYYLGESFVRNGNGLRWATGNRETVEANMPVVTLFRFGIEMAPIMVAENLLRRVIAEPAKLGDIALAVDHWRANIRT